MKSTSASMALSLLAKVLLMVFAPLALCGASIAICLAWYAGDRLTAAVMAMALPVATMLLPAMLMTVIRPSLVLSPRFIALMTATTSAAYSALVAMALGFGCALVSTLHARGGRVFLGAAIALLFVAAILGLFASVSRPAFGLHPALAVLLPLLVSSVLAFVGYLGTPALGWCLAVPSAAVVAAIFLIIPRYVPPPPTSLFDPPPHS